MLKRPWRSHAPACKAKVALEVLKGEQTIVELAQRLQVHTNHSSLRQSRRLECMNRSKRIEILNHLKVVIPETY